MVEVDFEFSAVSASPDVELTPGNDILSLTVTPRNADLSVQIVPDADPTVSGAPLRYVLAVRNAPGSNTATNVELSLVLPHSLVTIVGCKSVCVCLF